LTQFGDSTKTAHENRKLMPTHDFDWLLDPITVDAFRRKYLENKPLHLSGRAADWFTGLFSLEDLEHILWQEETQVARSVTLLKSGERIFPARSNVTGLRNWVDAQYADGATVLLPAVGRFIPSVARLQRSVERFAGGHVIINAYLTPPGAQGFEPHFDPHDIFVLQVAGAKHWRLFKPAVVLPTRAQARAVAGWELAEPMTSLVLNPGDLLYLPRGVVHEARTQDDTSLHLTIGFELPTWADVIEQCVRGAADLSLALRRSVAATPEPGPELRVILDELRALGNTDDMVGQALERIRGIFLAGLSPLPRQELGGSNPLSVRSADDYVERVHGMLAEVFTTSTAVHIAFPGLGFAHDDGKVPTTLNEPLFMEPALRFIATSEAAFRVCDLPVGVGDQAKLLFVRRLVMSGLLQLACSTP
jgi:ribosomal protein L16 Arg81 hydroxylase